MTGASADVGPVGVAGITVVGIGADGWDGLGANAKAAVRAAASLMGSARQLELVPAEVVATDQREVLPSPLAAALPSLALRDGLCVLASGDPMFHGIGATLARVVDPARLRVIPAVSSVSLAAARLGWPIADVPVVSLVSSPASAVLSELVPGGRVLVLARHGGTAAEVRAVLDEAGWAASRVTVLAALGGEDESVTSYSGGRTAELVVLALEAAAAPGGTVWPRVGLPDDAFESDGALTRREVRVLVLAGLRPTPGELLWDVGAGSGSVAVEWLRAAPGASAVAVEPRAERRVVIARNASRLGVPRLVIVAGTAPVALAELEQPQAVFVGGGVTAPGVLDACWQALPVGGRLVATAVTIETETVLVQWQRRVGGTLTRLELSRASPLGSFTAWRPELPIVLWETVKS